MQKSPGHGNIAIHEDHSMAIYFSIHILFVKLFCLVQFFAWFVWTAPKILHTTNLVVTVMAAHIVDETSYERERGNVLSVGS